jgi:hypothetical protein
MNRNVLHSLRLILLIAVIGLSNFGSALAASTVQDSRIERIGTPINSVTIPHAAYGKGPNGENWIYVTSNGSPAIMTVMDAKTGARIKTMPVEGGNSSWGMTTAPDGTIYIGSLSSLYHYIPGRDSMDKLGVAIPGETALWRIVSDDKGNIYGGTYPNGKVFKYDPNSGQFTDYGRMAQGESYVRSVAYGNGKVYAGTGSVQAQLFEIDPATGAKRSIPFPETYQHNKEVYDLTFVNGLLFARLTYSVSSSQLNNVTLVYDLKTEQWIDEFKGTPGFDVSPPLDGKVYFNQNNVLMAYDLSARKVTSTGFAIGNVGTTRSFGWFDFGDPAYPGLSLVSTNLRGKFFIYNPATGTGKVIQGDPLGAANALKSLGKGPDGNIYAGGLLSPSSMGKYNVAANQLESIAGVSQVEGMGVFQDKLYLGLYPNASIMEFDPKLPVKSGTNPLNLNIPLNSYGQDRPFAFTAAGNRLAIGTVPSAGHLGGTLSLYDPGTRNSEIYPNVVADQSIVTLAYKDGLIYGGTTIWGGYGIAPTQSEGKLFIWDPVTKAKLWEGTPVPGEQAVSSIAFDPQGMLWGITSGYLFEFDPAQMKVVRYEKLYDYTWNGSPFYVGGYLNFFKDGILYGNSVHSIFRLNPKTWEKETLALDASLFAQDDNGDIYFAKDVSELYRYRLETAAEIAASLTSIAAPDIGAAALALPVVPIGFSISIKSSDKPEVVKADGTIVPPKLATTVNLVLTVTRTSDGSQADTASIPVIVPSYDVTTPVTSSKVDQTAQNGWYKSDVTVMLSPYDDFSGVANTEYKLAGDSAWTAYTGPIQFLNEGSYQLQYHSTDMAGNVETAKVLEVNIDKTDPVYSLTANGSPFVNGTEYMDEQTVTFNLSASDPLSGVAGLNITLDGKPYANGTAIDLAGKLGAHTLRFVINDQAGNVTDMSMDFKVKTSVASLIHIVDRYIASGEIKGSLANVLKIILDQANIQVNNGLPKEAVKILPEFLKHLNDNPKLLYFSDTAKAVLEADLQALITSLSSGN